MNEKDKQMLETLIQDKGQRYMVIIDNDCVSVVDNENENFDFTFEEWGDSLLQQILQHIGINAEFC